MPPLLSPKTALDNELTVLLVPVSLVSEVVVPVPSEVVPELLLDVALFTTELIRPYVSEISIDAGAPEPELLSSDEADFGKISLKSAAVTIILTLKYPEPKNGFPDFEQQ